MTMLTKNFSLREMQCKCGCRAPVGVIKNLQRLAEALQALRDLAKSPIVVTSGYRCQQHNRNVGGAPNSQHVFGLAADIWSKTLTVNELHALAEQIPAFQNGGIGKYSRWIHVDIRNGRARW